MSSSRSARAERRPDVEAVDVDGELVLWDPIGRIVHRLDPVGSLLWPFLDGSATVAELAADVSEVWDVSLEQAGSALDALIDQLRDARLLRDAVEPSTVPSLGPDYLIDPPSP